MIYIFIFHLFRLVFFDKVRSFIIKIKRGELILVIKIISIQNKLTKSAYLEIKEWGKLL
ncbi:MAG: hypothetical protein BAJALOKI2v1_210014 [Promethearchaeota archaeon]|nr:MAG: hypothetical protein BAJALOKI2v1_210014 [Candidatus Lokiarchaeota archaeon]